MPQVLYSSHAVKSKVVELMKDDTCKRVIVVAFVGIDAEEYLEKPEGIQLICWPQPGSTNPESLVRLEKLGVKIEFCDRLHMKIYHSSRHGTVVASSNLTNNAFGENGLKEAGVFLNKYEFNIDRIINSLERRKPTKEDYKKLWEAYDKNLNNIRGGKASRKRKYSEWVEDSVSRKPFKLAVYIETDDNLEPEVINEANRFGMNEPLESFYCNKSGFGKGDWLLCAQVFNKKLTGKLSWMFVESKVFTPAQPDPLYRSS
ncbi:MAG: hypothetical protein IPN61_06465 [Bacteroidetes bacterium]|nr:hypothetical protein [Bacteroidota bacterium]